MEVVAAVVVEEVVAAEVLALEVAPAKPVTGFARRPKSRFRRSLKRQGSFRRSDAV